MIDLPKKRVRAHAPKGRSVGRRELHNAAWHTEHSLLLRRAGGMGERVSKQ